MLVELTILLGLGLVGEVGPERVEPSLMFGSWFELASRGRLEIPPSVALKASTFRYVFVGGFRNEWMPSYFVQNRAELRALGVPRSSIHVISPSSTRNSDRNAEFVRDRFQEISAEGPERLVVIAHSRGACDALAFAISNPSFFRDRIEALFLIQGPFGGSGAAEYAIGQGSPMDRRMPWGARLVGNLAGRMVRFMARKSGLEAVEGLTREASREFWSKTLAEHADAVASVSPRTFYIRSKIEPARLHFVRRAIAYYLKAYHGPSDGMVALSDQSLPAVGTVIATLEAGHGDLTNGHLGRASKARRKALSRSIFMAVGQPEPDLAKMDLKIDSGPILTTRPSRPEPSLRASAPVGTR